MHRKRNSSCVQAEKGDTMKIELTEENVLLAGRTYKERDTLWLALSGTGVSFIYTGK